MEFVFKRGTHAYIPRGQNEQYHYIRNWASHVANFFQLAPIFEDTMSNFDSQNFLNNNVVLN